MSDEKVTEQKSDPNGYECPAAKPLCSCGVRGCVNAKIHALAKAPRRSGSRWRI